MRAGALTLWTPGGLAESPPWPPFLGTKGEDGLGQLAGRPEVKALQTRAWLQGR